MASGSRGAPAAAAALGGADPELVEGGIGGASVIHSREKVSLCYEIILDHFGGIAARVAAILLQRGRLTLREISRFLANPTLHAPTGYIPDDGDAGADAQSRDASGVAGSSASFNDGASARGPLRSQRLIQQALLTLIQHNMCWHARTNANGLLVDASDEGYERDDAQGGTEYFQMNPDGVLPRLRFGAYLTISEAQYGEVGRAITNEVLQDGKLRASGILDRLAGQEGAAGSGDPKKRSIVREVLTDMLYEAYLQPYLPVYNAAPRDRRIHKEAMRVTQSKKLISESERKTIAQIARQEVASEDKAAWYVDNEVRRGLVRAPTAKRKVNGTSAPKKRGRPPKKPRLSNGHAPNGKLLESDSDEEDKKAPKGRENTTIDLDCVFRINFPRFDIHLRDTMVVEAVESRYNPTVARVMKTMLALALSSHNDETGVPGAHQPVSPSFHIHSVREQLCAGASLKTAFERKVLKQEVGSELTQSTLLGEIVEVLMGAGDVSKAGQAKRFVAPAHESSISTVSSASRPTTLQLQYKNVARALRQQILHNVVRAQFDAPGIRVMSLLAEKGKLDEKQISKVCLMAMSETRDVCARLFAAGLLSLQEVPKSNDRTAARTFFLWFVDVRKCNAWLANRLYKTLSRLAQRRRAELSRERSLVAKSHHRTDIANQESMMRDVERIRLQRVRDTIRLITLAELRTWRDLFVVTTLPE